MPGMDSDNSISSVGEAGEQLFPARSNSLPEFPAPKPLVFLRENTHLLAALLPALDKHKCLESYNNHSKKSPWVDAFWDLHGPDGPWGKYQHIPDPNIKTTKYAFKSYKIPAIHKHLRKYQGNSKVHTELLGRLNEYESKKKPSKKRIQKRKREITPKSEESEKGPNIDIDSEEEENSLSLQNWDEFLTQGIQQSIAPSDSSKTINFFENEKEESNSPKSRAVPTKRNQGVIVKKNRVQFEKEKRQILSQIPSTVKAQFRSVGFARWTRKVTLPVMFLGPYDVAPGKLRNSCIKKMLNVSNKYE